MPAPVLLVLLSIIGVPFEPVGMELVGPLPKSTCSHKYILVIVGYTTHYPGVVPLRKATCRNITRELVFLSSQVGIPSKILTNQGMPFISLLMQGLYRLLQVRHLHASMYYQQTNRLVEHFN